VLVIVVFLLLLLLVLVLVLVLVLLHLVHKKWKSDQKMAASLWILDLRMASERDHHPVAVVFVGLYVDREKKRKMCADKAIKVRVKKRTFPKLKQLKSSALSFSPLLVCKLDEWGSGLVLCSLVLWKSFGLLWWICVQTARYKSNLSKCSVIGAMYSQEGNTNGAYTQVLSLLYSL
jgi:hypothetical protein